MDKIYIKSQIAMRQAEFPTDLKPREAQLPIDSGKIVTKKSSMNGNPLWSFCRCVPSACRRVEILHPGWYDGI